jgi:hypothetical protein
VAEVSATAPLRLRLPVGVPDGVALAGAAVGLIASDRLLAPLFGGGSVVQYPAFTGWQAANGQPLVPMLFITIACGACSGFHSLIASGTTSKQLKNELDARPIGYGTMLLEAMVAIVSLCCVMVLAADSPLAKQSPNFVYALGMGGFLEILGVPAAIGVSFALMAFTTFVYDTLDVCTRLGRYIIQELTGMTGNAGGWLGTALTAEQMELVWRLSPEPVLCFDGDAAGQRAAVRAVELALPLISTERSLRIEGIYPWGFIWPPPPKSGNYLDKTADSSGKKAIAGYNDGIADAAPVGSYRADGRGLFDLSGNVWEWVADPWKDMPDQGVLRGGSFTTAERQELLASFRRQASAGERHPDAGFRLLLWNIGQMARADDD